MLDSDRRPASNRRPFSNRRPNLKSHSQIDVQYFDTLIDVQYFGTLIDVDGNVTSCIAKSTSD